MSAVREARAGVAFPPREPLPVWDPEADDVLICRGVRDETHDVKTFVFQGARPCLFVFRPGQFLTFSFMLGGEPVSRCYTISSPPTRPHTVSITVKRVRNGPVSNWLHDHLRPGMTVNAVGPMGAFTCGESGARKFLFLSGGSGITPMMSMSRAHDDVCSEADILFVHSARTPQDIIFRAEQDVLVQHRAGFRAVAVCEEDGPREAWSGLRGRLTPAMLQALAPDMHEREAYVCGPAPYMAAVRRMLADLAFDMTRYNQESFDFEDLSAGQPAVPDAIGALEQQHVHAAEFTRSRRQIEIRGGHSILEAARAAGLRLPSSCTKGMCGTCKSKLVSGTVAMEHAGGIRQREIDAGMILLCCSRPTSDVVIER